MVEKSKVMVLGGSLGIGLGISKGFLEKGWDVIAASINSRNLRKLELEFPQIKTKRFDINDNKSVDALWENSDVNGLNALVVSTGSISRKKIMDTDMEDFEYQVRTNFISVFYTLQKAARVMSKRGGSIVVLSSQMARRVHYGASPSYGASKAALESVVKHFAFEFASKKLRFNCLAPGSIDTELPLSMDKDVREKLRDEIPMKRLGKVSEIVTAVIFLAGEESNYVTGSTLYVTGGSFMN